MTLENIIKKIEEDLAWRSHNGKPLGYIVLRRELAEQLLSHLAKPAAPDHD